MSYTSTIPILTKFLQIHICDVSSPKSRVNLPAHHNINTLKKIALSIHGIAALLCSETIFITTIE